MKRLIWTALMLATCVLALPNAAQAKWWVFGKSDGEVSFKYIYINGIGFDENDTNITLYKDSLQDGLVKIQGRADAGKVAVGAVRVSIDGKETWDKAKMADNGTFEYSFRPESGKTYSLYIKAIDTAGKSSDVDIAHKELLISDRDLKSIIREALDRMIEAYELEDARSFMQYVSPDFAGDPIILERAVRKDFSFFDNIDMNYTINSIASGKNGQIYVSILYNRFLVSTKDGKPYRDKGITEFVFKLAGKGAQVFSMKLPLIFGVSDPGNVGTGIVKGTPNEKVINVGPGGTIVIGPPITDPGDSPTGIPTPVNLRVNPGWSRGGSYVSFIFEPDLDRDVALNYGVIVEESNSSSGPFSEVHNTPGYDAWQPNITSPAITGGTYPLYYRVRIYRLSDSKMSTPSNVIIWNNGH